jgi:amino acid/peptide:H+ symporter
MLVGLAVFLSFRHMLEGRGLRPSNEHAATHEKRPPLSDREKLRMALVAGLGGIAALLYAWNLQPPTFVAGVRATFWPLAVTFVATIWVFLMGRTHGVERRNINVIFIIGFFVMVFWCAFEQAGSSLTLFAENSTRCWIFSESWSFESSQFQTINPLCIVLFGPLFSMLWTWLALRGRDPSIPAKMAIGILINAASFGLMIFAAHAATHASADGQKLSPMWLTAFYVLQTCAELCLSPIGLSMVTRLAPARFAAMAMGIWFMSTAFGYKLAGSFGGKYDQYGPDQLFGAIALALTLAGVVLIFVVPALKRRMSDEK